MSEFTSALNLGPFFCLLMVHKGKVEEKAYKKGSKGHVCGTVRIPPSLAVILILSVYAL